MSFDYKGLDFSWASTSAAVTQYDCLIMDTVGNVKEPTAANNSKIAGIAQEPVTAAGQSISVRWTGKSKARAFAATAVGDLLATAEAGGRIGTNNAPAAGTDTVGRGMEAATAQNDIFAVLVFVNAR